MSYTQIHQAMKQLFFALIFLITLVFAASAQVKPLLTDNPLRSHLDSAVQNGAEGYMADTGAVGLCIGIYRSGHGYVYNYGESVKGSGKIIRGDEYFNMGSVAKTFAGTMLAEAVIEKKANLTDDIRKYLPGNYPNLAYQGHPVTLVDMASHTSAMPGSLRKFPARIMDSLSKKGLPAMIQFYARYDQDSVLKDLHNFKIDTIPGTRYQYNGNAMMILIFLLERIYHQPYEQLVTHYLQTHLQMYETHTSMPADQLARFMQGYGNNGQPVIWFDKNDTSRKPVNTNLYYTGGPSMNSTMDDMIKYLKANIEEKEPAILLSHQPTYTDTDGSGIGLNWMFDVKNGERYYYHSGHTRLGFNTICVFYPKEQLGFMIVVNDNISQDKVSALEEKIKDGL
jgi:CubicO group peptidase (beta-lactamase class C family)